jgi:ABC-type uncharacterized transport system YnjBCD ATPase subunit
MHFIVTQDDILHAKLTVRENILYNALLRLPFDMEISQKISIVDDVIKILGLVHIQNSLVGDPEARGISGGQRKRVNMYLQKPFDQNFNCFLVEMSLQHILIFFFLTVSKELIQH